MNPSIHNNGVKGFVDPVSPEYDHLFNRKTNGEIIASGENVELANYIIKSLQLWLPVRELMWKLEKIKSLNIQIKDLLEVTNNEVTISELRAIHYELLCGFESIVSKLMFENNE